MKNKFFVFLVSLFTPFIVVNAGVCDGEYQNDSYCNFGHSYSYNYGDKFAKNSSSNGWIGYPYIPKSNDSTVSGTAEYGFCLDPGLKSPTDVNYTYAREINTNYFFDKNVYRVYQGYVNALAYDGNDSNKSRYLGYSDIALRTFTFINSNGTMCNSSSHSSDCTAIFNNNTLKSNRFKQFSDTIAPYINDKITTVGNGFDFKYWATSSDIEKAKDYFLKLKNELTLWDNPLLINPTLTFDAETNIYTFNFEVNFTNSTSKYFGSNDSGLLNGDYNIGYGDAFFDYELKINDGTFTPEGNAIDYTGGGMITKYTENANSTRNIYLKMSKDTYDSIVSQTGKVVVNLVFSTYHPMSSDNIFLNYNNNRSDNSVASYQRMVVFSKYVSHGQINSDGSSENSNLPEYSMCSQNENKFYFGLQEIGIEEYKVKCSCPNIDKSKISNSNIKNKSNELCPTTNVDKVDSTLNSCTTENVPGNNTITRKTESNISNNNTFCTLTCDETINISGMVNSFQTLSGRYFNLPSYPSLNASKNCTVNIAYSEWKKTYLTLLEDEKNAYNTYLKDKAINNASQSIKTCSCGWDCSYNSLEYNYSYVEYSIIDGIIKTNNVSGRYGGCDNIRKPSTNSNKKNEAILADKQSKLTEHFENLKSCNNYLSTIASGDFYKFNADLSFYYEQTSSTKGNFWNNNKPNYINNVDDSKFDAKAINIASSSGNYLNYTSNNKEYTYFTINGMKEYKVGLDVSGDYSINRNVIYKYDFTPSKDKYVESFTGIISSNKNSIKNPISLGKVYDVDITAISKTDNNNYYLFKSLGDNNKIYEKLSGKEINGLKRTCTYETVNEMIGCTGNNCNDENKPKPLYVFRIVDSNNLDPNNRLLDKSGKLVGQSSNNGFRNWRNDKGLAVKQKIESDDTYNPENLEYSFTLDSATIKDIREYNKIVNYSSTSGTSELSCDSEGNKCKSKFIEEALKNSPNLNGVSTKRFATKNSGSSSWKIFTKEGTKCLIDGEWIKNVTCNS